MKQKSNIILNESELFDDDNFIIEDDAPNQGGQQDNGQQNQQQAEKKDEAMDEQQLHIESLKIATKIAKLFDQVTPSELLEISDKVYKFIQHQNTSGEWDPTYGFDTDENSGSADEDETPEDVEAEDFDLDDVEDITPEEEAEENKDEEDKEAETADETAGEIPDDIFDFEV